MSRVGQKPIKIPAGVKVEENNNWVEIKISDTGVGFTAEEQGKLFNKFGKIERFGQGFNIDIEGPGFGLYISNEIIKLHNGILNIHSDGRNKGSFFTIKLKKENY